MKNKWLIIGGIIGLMIILLSVYFGTRLKINNETASEKPFMAEETLPTVDSKENLNDYFLKIMKEQQNNTKFFARNDMAESDAKISSSEQMDTASSSPQGFSKTNVQVEGIDEGDAVKTDGKYIFKVIDGKVQIINAVPSEKMALDSIINYDETFQPFELFLHEDELIVIGQSYKELAGKKNTHAAKKLIAPAYLSTKAIIYDIKNKKKPKKIRELDIEGSLVTSRLMDGKIYLITNHFPDIWILRENPDIDLRPRYFDSAEGVDFQTTDYTKIHYFPDSNETNMTSIAVVNLEEPKSKLSITTFLGNGSEIYMSKNNLYLAVSNYAPLTIDKGETFFSPDTSVYKFSIDGKKVAFRNTAKIPGTVLNQFSMDEHNGYFRIATTKGQAWDEKHPSSNNLYILDENLKQAGQLEDLARGERIYSARFMNDRIFIVTFKETDPLFVIDASLPEQPKVLGELKIPGFSNYLHPIDENHLIGFGHDTKVQPGKGANKQPIITTEGVKISLFDVSDLSNPKEKFTEVIGGRGTYSPLNHDHKTLLFHKQKHLFAFPVTVYQNVKNNQYNSNFEFQGVYVYQVDSNNGFSLKSKITHQNPKSIYEEWENTIDRIVYIEDTLYALSPEKVTSHDLNSFKQKGELILQ